ncbi:MAG: amino acid decarboxylase [Acidobacteria bacterium]|nr:amino acid decarboxylase [Acidobacteriota bacterium]
MLDAYYSMTEQHRQHVARVPKRTLDPSDWRAHRDVAHRALDEMLDYQQGVADGPAWRAVPAELDAEYQTPAPLEAQGIERAYDDFLRLVMPYPTGNAHPRFWGWVPGQGTPGGLIAALLAGGMNNVSGQFNDGASRVHDQVITWMIDAMGFPTTASGILTSGGSVANLVGIAVGRDAQAGFDTVAGGLAGEDALRVYGSVETHSSVVKAAQLLGIGRDNVVLVPINDRFEIDAAALAEAIQRDRKAGHRPAVLIGNAGTVGTGATDDLDLLADIAADANLWFHVDGAFGAIAAWSDETRHLVRGLDRADSLAFDLHKWTSVPYDVGCVLVRDADAHHRSFASAANYLEPLDRGTAAVQDPTNGRGLQLSRGFRALKVWMSIKEHGMARFGEVAADCVRQTSEFSALVERRDDLELMAPAPMCIACFRYAPRGVPDDQLDGLNREILMRLQEEGIAVPSSTRIDGSFALRVANTNHRTTFADLEHLAEETVRLGRSIYAGN